jgi:hypothetical protein
MGGIVLRRGARNKPTIGGLQMGRREFSKLSTLGAVMPSVPDIMPSVAATPAFRKFLRANSFSIVLSSACGKHLKV